MVSYTSVKMESKKMPELKLMPCCWPALCLGWVCVSLSLSFPISNEGIIINISQESFKKLTQWLHRAQHRRGVHCYLGAQPHLSEPQFSHCTKWKYNECQGSGLRVCCSYSPQGESSSPIRIQLQPSQLGPRYSQPWAGSLIFPYPFPSSSSCSLAPPSPS